MLERWSNVLMQGIPVVVALAVFLFLILRYRRAPFGSLSSQLLLSFSGVVTISLVIIIAAFTWQTRVILTDQTGEAFLAVARSESQRLGEQLAGETTLLQNLAGEKTFFHHIINTSDIRLGTLSPAERTARLQVSDDAWINQTDQVLRNAVLDNLASIELDNFARDFLGHTQLTLTDAYGRLVAAGGDTPAHYYYGKEAWWREAWNEGYGNVYVGKLSLTPGQQTTTIEIAVPVYCPLEEGEDIRTAEKVAVGVLNSRFAIRNLQVFAGISSIDATGALSLVDDTSLVLYSFNPDLVGTQLAEGFRADIAADPFDWGVNPDETGQDIIHSHAVLIAPPGQPYLDSLGWVIVVQQAKAAALSAVRRFSQVTLLGGLLALASAIAIGSWSARQLTRPIQELTKTAFDMAGGQLKLTARISGPTELRTLARAFNDMTAQLGELIGSLEQRVADRTRELERRSSYQEASAEVGRAASSILDTDRLIRQVVDLIRERFELYYVGLFLVDETGEWAVLRAGTGEAGLAMLGRSHRLRVGQGMIGWSIANAQARVALEAEADAVRSVTAELPDTRSEAALPLRSRGQVIGALTVQSDRPGVFDEVAIAVLQTMADQVAVALDNARLFQQVQESVETERRAYGELSREAWAELARGRSYLGYRYDESGVVPVNVRLELDDERGGDGDGQPGLALPIKVRGRVIATIKAHKPDGAGDWAAEEAALLETLANQVGVALEGARLYQDTQLRAARERLTSEITARMRETLDVETILQTAVREMRQALGLHDVTIQLEGADETRSEPGDESRRSREGKEMRL
jgi:GAF domain-containing protein/HAMP domain-containing protein